MCRQKPAPGRAIRDRSMCPPNQRRQAGSCGGPKQSLDQHEKAERLRLLTKNLAEQKDENIDNLLKLFKLCQLLLLSSKFAYLCL